MFFYKNMTLEQLLSIYLDTVRINIEKNLSDMDFKKYLELTKLMTLTFDEKQIANIFSELNTDKSLINNKDINIDLMKI